MNGIFIRRIKMPTNGQILRVSIQQDGTAIYSNGSDNAAVTSAFQIGYIEDYGISGSPGVNGGKESKEEKNG